jgi:hypothetical protein
MRGNAAEALHALVKRGLDVFVPFGSGHPFDLAVYVPGAGFLRVQCKRGWPLRGCVVFNVDAVAASEGRLRLEPTRNNQKRGIRFATEFEIGAWTEDRLAGLVAATRAPAA